MAKEKSALVITIPSAMNATAEVLTAIAKLPTETQLALHKAMQPLAPAKRGMKLAPDTRTQFPFLNLRQKSTENAPDACKIGEYFDDAMTPLGKEIPGYVLLYREERILFSGSGLACRSPDRKHGIRGQYCEDCPDKPVFRRDGAGQTFKDGDCNDCIGLMILTSDFGGLYRYMIKGKAGQPVQKMLRKMLTTTDEIFSRAYRFYSEKREAGGNNYQAHLVEPAEVNNAPVLPTAAEMAVIEFLFDKVQNWSDADVAEAENVTKQAAEGAGDGPVRGGFGPGDNVDTVDVTPSTEVSGEEGEKAPDPEDHSGNL